VDASTVCRTLIRARWGIETAFQKLESHLNSEINTLGYPKAALFGFCLALVAFNIYAIVMAALRATHRNQAINETVSEYYVAQEIATTTGGMLIAVPADRVVPFYPSQFGGISEYPAQYGRLCRLEKVQETSQRPEKTTDGEKPIPRSSSCVDR